MFLHGHAKKKDWNLGASGREAAKSFSSKLVWIIKHNMNDFYLMMHLNDFNMKFWDYQSTHFMLADISRAQIRKLDYNSGQWS